tara:strand:+ start:668 stop:790 length:123 start_codon:yes stop_codon:yes gene_type:complete
MITKLIIFFYHMHCGVAEQCKNNEGIGKNKKLKLKKYKVV